MESVQPGHPASDGAPIEAFARDLLQIVRAVKLYPPGHPHVIASADRLVRQRLRQADDMLTIAVSSKELAVDGVTYGRQGTWPSMMVASGSMSSGNSRCAKANATAKGGWA